MWAGQQGSLQQAIWKVQVTYYMPGRNGPRYLLALSQGLLFLMRHEWYECRLEVEEFQNSLYHCHQALISSWFVSEIWFQLHFSHNSMLKFFVAISCEASQCCTLDAPLYVLQHCWTGISRYKSVKKVLQEFDKDYDIVVVCAMVSLPLFYQASQEQHYSHKRRVQVKNTFFD
jgi:hypothetical protein